MVDTLPVSPPLKVTLEFSGGAELLFEKQKSIAAELPPLKKYLPECKKQNWTMRELLQWIEAYYLRERPELFLQGESVRPGLLVLINESDWELYDELEYEIKDNDTITFISTLHGG